MDYKKEVLTEREQFSLAAMLLPMAQKMLVCSAAVYDSTKYFDRDGSIYHTFGLHNEVLHISNSVTYEATRGSISFLLHNDLPINRFK